MDNNSAKKHSMESPKAHSKCGVQPCRNPDGILLGGRLSNSGHPYKRTQPTLQIVSPPTSGYSPPYLSPGWGRVGASHVARVAHVAERVPLSAQAPAHLPHMNVQGAQNPGALGPPNPRAEKRRFIQQHLVLILHATQCRRKQLHEFCQLPHCATFRDVLTHMSTCHRDSNCPYPHCASSKQIYRHWKACHRADCLICVPIRLADRLERNHY